MIDKNLSKKKKKKVYKEGTHQVRRNKVVKILYWIMFGLLTLSFLYGIFMMIKSPSEPSHELEMVKSDYFLMTLQSFAAIFILFLPSFLEKKFNIDIPMILEIAMVVFIYMAIILGETRNYYYKFKYWDSILHFVSGIGFGLIGFSIINILNKSNRVANKLSPRFILFFALCFGLSIGMLWEIYEFTVDSLFGTNMQKYMPEGYLNFSDEKKIEFFRTHGLRYALMDTMKDLIIDFCGAVVAVFFGYFLIKYKNGKLDNILIKIVDDDYLKKEKIHQISIDEFVKEENSKKELIIKEQEKISKLKQIEITESLKEDIKKD